MGSWSARAGRRLADFLALTKPRVVLMIPVTTAVGFHVGSLRAPDPVGLLHTLLATALSAGGVLTLNQFLERDTDALMARTRSRPLPVIEPDGCSTGRQIVSNCLALLAVGLLPTLIGLTGSVYFLGAMALGTGLLGCGVALAISRSAADARRLVFASLVYLPALLVLMALTKVPF